MGSRRFVLIMALVAVAAGVLLGSIVTAETAVAGPCGEICSCLIVSGGTGDCVEAVNQTDFTCYESSGACGCNINPCP